MNKTLKIIVWIVVLALVAWGLSAINKQAPASPESGETIKIGALIPLTGIAAAIGEENRQGIELAVKDLKIKYPELNLEVYYEDTAYDPKTALSVYERVRSLHNVSAVISGGTKISGPLKEVADRDRVVQMAIWSAAREYSETHDLNYRTTPLSDDNAPVLLEYMKEKNLKKLAVFYPIDDFGVTYKEAFEKLASGSDVEIVSMEGYVPTEKDFKTSLTKIKGQTPDVFFAAGTAPQLGNIFKQARDIGIDAQFMSQGAAENKQMLDGAGVAAEGLVYSYYFDPSDENASDFANQYQALYGRVASQYVAEAYTGLMLIGEAANTCGNKVNQTCWKNYLDNLSNLPTVLGLTSVDERGDLKPAVMFLKTVKNGQFVRLEE